MAESIVDALGEKETLVVLDNCEHLIAAAARMVDAIVRACPGVRVLATSREGLGVRGERIMSVPSLELPLDGSSVEAAGHDRGRAALRRPRARGRRAASGSTPTTRRRSWPSATGSMGSRSPWSWPRRGPG